jgi:hypothetical protein
MDTFIGLIVLFGGGALIVYGREYIRKRADASRAAREPRRREQ